MIKRLLSVAFGAALALELQRWWESRRARLSPGALTGSLLDKVNSQLEARRAGR
ncbi:MAG: hypothetical protein ACRDJV_03015 [Actinomycetota bacterium]